MKVFAPAPNIAESFLNRVAVSTDKTAFLHKARGIWQTVTWKDYENEVYGIATALYQEQVRVGDAVAILAQTRPEWSYIDIAVMSLGAVTVPVYAASIAEDIFHILKDSRAKVLFVENRHQLEKIHSLQKNLPDLKLVVSLEPVGDAQCPKLSEWTQKARVTAEADASFSRETWIELIKKITPTTPATLMYTSGTTGTPKPVLLNHNNFQVVIRDTIEALELKETDSSLLFLPVAHIIGRIEQLIGIYLGWSFSYAENINTIRQNLSEMRPTVFLAVPRVFEKFYEAFCIKVSQFAIHEKIAFDLAMKVAKKYSATLQKGLPVPTFLKLEYKWAEQLFFGKIREYFGGRLRFAVSGGAPLSSEIAEFFHMCGILVLEGYGLTETTGPVTMNRPSEYRFGSVGKPLSWAQVKIESDGEVVVSGEGVSPSVVASSGAKFSTGDIGQIDADGFLKITDRKKDLIITSGGKNIPPQRIEQAFKSDPIFSHVLVVGDGQKYLAAIFSMNIDESRRLAKENHIAFKEVEELATHPAFRKLVAKRVERINQQLASYEAIKRFELLMHQFTIEAGELTPTQKVRRKFCEKKYASLIAKLYDDKEQKLSL